MKRSNASAAETLVFIIPFINISFPGAAYLAKNKAENKEYIAKKILLGSLDQKE